jgi:hypothetical protein
MTGQYPGGQEKYQRLKGNFSRSDKPKINEGRHARYQAERPSVKERHAKVPGKTGQVSRKAGQVSRKDRVRIKEGKTGHFPRL